MILRGRRSRKKNTRVFGDDWDNREDSDEQLPEVNNGDDQGKCTPLPSMRCPVATAKHRRRKRNSRYLGDEWDNNEDIDEYQSSKVKSHSDKEVCVPLGSKDCAVVTPKDIPRKKNSRYFGDDWDNMEDSDEHQSPLKNQHDKGTARFPKKHAVVHQIGRDAIARGKQLEKEPERVLQIDEYFDENADPNEPGPSVWRRVRCKQVMTSSDSGTEWVPQEESLESEEDVEDDNHLLLADEWSGGNHNEGIAIGHTVDVEYLDHGGFCVRCEHCHAGLYEAEKIKRDGKITGGSLCCHNGKSAILEAHFPRVPEPLQSLFNDYTSREGKLFHSNIRYINSALQMASTTAGIKHTIAGINETTGPSMMVAQGNIYHLLNPMAG